MVVSLFLSYSSLEINPEITFGSLLYFWWYWWLDTQWSQMPLLPRQFSVRSLFTRVGSSSEPQSLETLCLCYSCSRSSLLLSPRPWSFCLLPSCICTVFCFSVFDFSYSHMQVQILYRVPIGFVCRKVKIIKVLFVT